MKFCLLALAIDLSAKFYCEITFCNKKTQDMFQFLQYT